MYALWADMPKLDLWSALLADQRWINPTKSGLVGSWSTLGKFSLHGPAALTAGLNINHRRIAHGLKRGGI